MITIQLFEYPKWFDPEAYLRDNPDVDADPYWRTNPLGHWISSGYKQVRTWNGDPRQWGAVQPPEPKPSDPTEPSEPTTKTIVAEVWGESYMSMEKFSNKRIFFGTYSFPKPDSHIYADGYKDPIAKLPVGESVFRFREDNGYIYVACEYQEIWRSLLSDTLSGYDFQLYKRLAAGKQRGAFDIQRFSGGGFGESGKLVFVGGGEIYTDGHGTTKELGQDYYVKFGFQCLNTAFVAGYSYGNKCAGWFDSADALSWKWKNIGPKYSRFMQAAVSTDQKSIWLVGTCNYKNGHNRDSATLWRYDVPTGELQWLYTFPGFDYISCIKIGPDGKPYFILTRGWRSQESGATLVRCDGTTPYGIAEFEKGAEGRELVFDDEGNLWCVLRTDLVGGWVYKIPGVL